MKMPCLGSANKSANNQIFYNYIFTFLPLYFIEKKYFASFYIKASRVSYFFYTFAPNYYKLHYYDTSQSIQFILVEKNVKRLAVEQGKLNFSVS